MAQYPLFRHIQEFNSPPFIPQERSNHQSNIMLADKSVVKEVLLQSINRSYLGRMSNQKQIQNLTAIEEEQFISNPKYISSPKKKRINFSKFRGYAKEQSRQPILKQKDMQYLYIKSLLNSKGQELLDHKKGCFFCQNHKEPTKCLLKLINQSTLQIYISNDKAFSEMIISLNFDTISADISFEKIPQNNDLMIQFGGSALLLYHQDNKVLQHWYQSIQKMIDESKGKQYNLTKLLKDQQFFKRRYQTEDFFTKNCQTGDVILFQDNHFFAKVQRFVTRSDFDHVGMIVKHPQHGLLLFESNGGTGVSLVPWRSVIRYGWYANIPRISWRRLKTQRNQHFNDIVGKFVTDNLKKDYHISLGKLTAHQSIVRTPGVTKKKQQGNESDDSGFFCSELVATLYKDLGLLTRDKTKDSYQPACKFYPKDFSQRSGRNLDNNGELSPQYEIYFDYVLLKQNYKGLKQVQIQK